MGYDMWFGCPCCKRIVEEHYATYNYQPIFAKLFGDKGIRSLYGHKAKVVAWKVADAIQQLDMNKGRGDGDGWDATEGNVHANLEELYKKASRIQGPCILEGD